MRLYKEIIDRTGAQTTLYLTFTCTMISSVDLAHYGVSRVKIWYLWIVVQEHINVEQCFYSHNEPM